MAINPNNTRQLPSTVYDGLTITVQGYILPNANSFSVNLSTGRKYGRCDTALHVNPRYSQNNVVVRNSFISGGWGAEERGGAPFHVSKGQQLNCVMLVQNDVIKVAFNGQHYCDYRHRIPKERITHVIVQGDMQLLNVTFCSPTAVDAYSGIPGGAGGGVNGYPSTGVPSVPGPYPLPVPMPYPVPAFGQPIAASTPNQQFIPGGLFPGRLIYITATPGSSCTVNLKYQHGGDIAFHFNPRLNEQVVVRNSLLGGNWGREERDQPSFPFQSGQQFTLIILCEPNEFKVAVNNQHFITYRSRTPHLQAIQWVEVLAASVSSIVVH